MQPQEHDPRYQQPATPAQWQGQPGYGEVVPYYPPQPPQGWQPYPAQQVAPKSTAAALIMSFFVPGLGSMYAGQVGMGVVILIFWLISWPLMLAVVGLFTLPACWIWGMIAGYTDARAWNRAHGIIS